jgi:hypothetical protein
MAKPETVAMFEAMMQVHIPPQVHEARATMANIKIDPAVLALAGQVGRMRIGLDRSVIDALPRIA